MDDYNTERKYSSNGTKSQHIPVSVIPFELAFVTIPQQNMHIKTQYVKRLTELSISSRHKINNIRKVILFTPLQFFLRSMNQKQGLFMTKENWLNKKQKAVTPSELLRSGSLEPNSTVLERSEFHCKKQHRLEQNHCKQRLKIQFPQRHN